MRYDYECQGCKKQFEVERRLSDTTPVDCPECDSQDVKKIILSSAAIFVNWKRSAGTNSRGFLILPSVKNKRLQEAMNASKS